VCPIIKVYYYLLNFLIYYVVLLDSCEKVRSAEKVGQYKPSDDCFDIPTGAFRLEDLPHPSELYVGILIRSSL